MRLDTAVVARESAAWSAWLSACEAETAAWEAAAAAAWELAGCENALKKVPCPQCGATPSASTLGADLAFIVFQRQFEERANALDARSAAEAALDAASANAKTLGDKWETSTIELKCHKFREWAAVGSNR